MSIKNLNVFHISVFVLSSLMLFLLFNYYKISSEHNAFVKKSITENKVLQNQFDEILFKYDSVVQTNNIQIDNTSEVLPYEDKMPLKKIANMSNLNISKQINILKNTIESDKKTVAVLENKIKTNTKALNRLISISNDDKKSNVSTLTAVNINARGVKIISDLYSNASNKKIEQIRVCFTLGGDEFVKKEEKSIFIQVVNPKNQIISINKTSIELNNIQLMYSEKLDVFYNQKDTDVCTFVNLEKEKTIKGKYIINVYNDFKKIGTTTFEYN